MPSRTGLSDRIVSIINSMHEDTWTVYRHGDTETEWVGSRRRVWQCCVRLRNSGYGIWVGEERLSHLLYEDDITVMSEDSGKLQEMPSLEGILR